MPEKLAATAGVATKSEFASWAEQINDRIAKLDGYAARLGSKYGLGSDPQWLYPDNENTEHITLEPVQGNWGLYYHRHASHEGQKPFSHLRDAPLKVRERFLELAEEFFRQYIDSVETRLQQVKASVAGGDAALAFLASKLDQD
jgi:hypothetical protein